MQRVQEQLTRRTWKEINKLVKSLVSEILEKGLAKDKEFEADKIGVELAYEVGYDPRTFLSVLNKLKGVHGAGWIKTHPSAEERISQLQPVLAKCTEWKNCPEAGARFRYFRNRLK